MTHRTPRLLCLALTALLVPGVVAEDWPQWRGPHRDGRSSETGLATSWPAAGPSLLLRASGFGGGFSSLAIVGDRLYTLGDVDGGQHVIAADKRDGKILWTSRIGPVWQDEYGGARSTPTIDGARLYALGTEGDLVCLETATGKLVWQRNLAKDFGGHPMKIEGTDWKFAESPLVDGERVIVTPGTRTAGLVALDKATGRELWRAALPELGEKGADGAGYSSVVISEAGGVRQYVQMLGRGVVGVEAATGKFLWGYNRIANNVANIPTPIIDGEHVFVSTGYGTGAALLRLDRDGEGIKATEVYFLSADELQNHHGGLILHGGHVYGGTGHNKGFPIAVEMTSGKKAWGPERNEGQGSAAVLFADGRLYFRYQNGRMVLIEATPAGYRETGSFLIPEVAHPSWSHPVISDRRLYLREQDNLFVYDVAAP